ncbi:helix-turn-helix domain-containing protein [Flavobacterium sp. FlaQc-50]|jgi:AraC-like DNA-binding protein|uniref:helix-turn-helix domain-containing protein n=1 Tax=unclassified Flavobacterium TaxID=196869 RepID=UPI0037579F44
MVSNQKTISLVQELNNKIGIDIKQSKLQSINTTSSSVNPSYGCGKMYTFETNGIFLHIIDIKLNKCVDIEFNCSMNSLLATYIVNGYCLFRFKNNKTETLYRPFMQYLQMTNDSNAIAKFGKEESIYIVQIVFSEEYMKKYNPVFLYNNAQTIFNNTIPQEIIRSIIELGTITKKKLCFHLYIESKCISLLSSLIESFTRDESTTQNQNLYLKYVYDIKKYIDKNLHLNHTLDELNKSTGISNFILNKEFSRFTGKSVAKYIKSKKMILAKDLVTKTSLPVYEIADRIGYKNATHFSNAFKKHFKTCPKDYQD